MNKNLSTAPTSSFYPSYFINLQCILICDWINFSEVGQLQTLSWTPAWNPFDASRSRAPGAMEPIPSVSTTTCGTCNTPTHTHTQLCVHTQLLNLGLCLFFHGWTQATAWKHTCLNCVCLAGIQVLHLLVVSPAYWSLCYQATEVK